jgi:hypothetical protein
MTTFLTYSIFSLSTSSSIPMQSEYLPAVTVFYILSTLSTFVSFSWFVVENFFRSHKWLPLPLRLYVKMLRCAENSIADAFKKIKCKPRRKVEILPTVSAPEIQVVVFLFKILKLVFNSYLLILGRVGYKKDFRASRHFQQGFN